MEAAAAQRNHLVQPKLMAMIMAFQAQTLIFNTAINFNAGTVIRFVIFVKISQAITHIKIV